MSDQTTVHVTPARRAYRQLRRYARGPRSAFAQDRLRPRILGTPPVRTRAAGDSAVEVHVLTSSDDWLNLVWALKSYYRMSGREDALCMHDDGSLPAGAVDVLRRHFPDARLIRRAAADRDVPPTLGAHPRCAEFRRTNHLAPKVFDFRHYLTADRMLLLDSDVLFFRRPDTLLDRLDDPGYRLNAVNGDVASAYTVDAEDARRLAGVELVQRFNSGLGVIHRDSLRFDWVEEFLGLPGVLGHFWRIEQTLYALCSSRFGCELLPPEYDVFLDGSLNDRPSRHYVGAVRHLMYSEGMRKLAAEGFLR